MTISDYIAAALRLHLAVPSGLGVHQVEEPFALEDGQTFQLRAWLSDGSDISVYFDDGG